ncbi:hypothetical protein GCM10011512_13700 [Tersicoccus solisilvae]|uniref:HNH nuclease domain-containing protein n=1 Tax=Tersicoccus solisilvae TaxID=1882339 RepID=A0ABQ1P0R5_9MICC|nr:hypothetical protein GCM10011512_13700 [Tersicoccus solisilvae]
MLPPLCAAAAVGRLREPDDLRTVEAAVAALEDVRRLESWLAWTKHRVARATLALSAADHERWVDAHPLADGSPGLSRAERLAVGERSAVAEIAGALQVGEKAASGLVNRADLLADHLRATDSALRDGLITGTAAGIVADAVQEFADLRAATTDPSERDALVGAIETTETVLLSHAAAGSRPESLKARARRLHEQCHPRSFRERHEAALAERYVRIAPDRDGMAQVTALLPAAVAVGIDARLTALARSLQSAEPPSDDGDRGSRTPSVPRTLAQLRADVLADLLAGAGLVESSPGATGSTVTPAPRLLLTIPAATLLGGDEPGILDSFGPIGADDARRLAAAATSFQLAVTTEAQTPPGPPARPIPRGRPDHLDGSAPSSSALPGEAHRSTSPVTAGSRATPGRPTRAASAAAGDAAPATPTDPVPSRLSGSPPGPEARVIPVVLTDGQVYRVPERLRRALAVRDGTCRFPGCRRSAMASDVDHILAWADGGLSDPENLAHLCRKHHVLKHHSAWSVAAEAAPATDEGDPASASTAGRTAATAATAATAVATDRLVWTSPAGRRLVTAPEPPPF